MIQEFQTYIMKNRGYSIHTAIAYGKDLQDFARWMSKNKLNPRWSTIEPADIENYVRNLHDLGKKPTTINRHIASIRKAYYYMKMRGIVDTNPARYIESNKIDKTIPNTIPTAELKNALDASAGTMKVMLTILCKTGVRIQEMLDIELQDIEAANGRIRIHGKGRKERYVYLKDGDMRTITEFAKGRPSRIFGDISQRDVRHAIFETLRTFSNARQLSPHAIRHTYATEMAKAGANVTTIAQILGHESIKTTQKYIDLGQQNIRRTQLQFEIFN